LFPEEVNASDNILWMVRFFERSILTKIARFVGCSCGPCGQDYVDVGVVLANQPGETEAVHLAVQPNL